jgi:hypothetical protein
VDLPRIPADLVCQIARQLEITDHDKGTRVPWVPTEEQRIYWRALEEHRLIFAAKPRQIGASTADDVYQALWVATCEQMGHPVTSLNLIDIDDNVAKRISQMDDFLTQLGEPHRKIDGEILFPGGSKIMARGAGGSSSGSRGRSQSVQRIRITEWPFFTDPSGTFGSVMQSLSLSGQAVIETTLEPSDPIIRRTWDGPNEWHKVFFSVEQHAEYKRDAKLISDEEWLRLMAEGFKTRETASYFVWARDNRCGGDELRAMREYPAIEAHMFMAAEGLYVRARPRVLEPVDTLTTTGVDAIWKSSIYRQPSLCGPCVILVDTAEGKGLSRSVVLVMDRSDGKIVACFASADVRQDDLARIVLDLQHAFVWSDRLKRPHSAIAIIEANGPGSATVLAATRIGVRFDKLDATAQTRDEVLLLAKRAVEGGHAFGPAELVEECDELRRDPVTGAWKGRKDILVCIGMGARDRQRRPFAEPIAPKSRERIIDAGAYLRDEIVKQRRRMIPR